VVQRYVVRTVTYVTKAVAGMQLFHANGRLLFYAVGS